LVRESRGSKRRARERRRVVQEGRQTTPEGSLAGGGAQGRSRSLKKHGEEGKKRAREGEAKLLLVLEEVQRER
jgi:hypothetical protein